MIYFISASPIQTLAIIAVSILVGLILLLNILANFVLLTVFKQRSDFGENIKYFTHNDFPSLSMDEFTFQNKNGKDCLGFIYKYNFKEYTGIVVLCHGMGPGHTQYTNEINYFCKRGYVVFAYEVPGTGYSKDKSMGGFEENTLTLEGLLEYTKNEKLPVYLFGHSWGGYASLTCDAKKYNIKAIVALAPARDFLTLLYGSRPLLKFLTIPFVTLFKYPHYLGRNTYKTSKLNNVPTLLYYSKTDSMVRFHDNIEVFVKHPLASVTLKEVNKDTHRLNLLNDNVEYSNKFFESLKNIKDPKQLNDYLATVNWELLVDLDLTMMEEIVSFYQSHE